MENNISLRIILSNEIEKRIGKVSDFAELDRRMSAAHKDGCLSFPELLIKGHIYELIKPTRESVKRYYNVLLRLRVGQVVYLTDKQLIDIADQEYGLHPMKIVNSLLDVSAARVSRGETWRARENDFNGQKATVIINSFLSDSGLNIADMRTGFESEINYLALYIAVPVVSYYYMANDMFDLVKSYRFNEMTYHLFKSCLQEYGVLSREQAANMPDLCDILGYYADYTSNITAVRYWIRDFYGVSMVKQGSVSLRPNTLNPSLMYNLSGLPLIDADGNKLKELEINRKA